MDGKKDMPAGFTIREFRLGEYAELLRLWERAGLGCKPEGRDSLEEMRKQMGREFTIPLVVEGPEGELVASLFCTHDGRRGWINRLAVAPGHRNKGIARSLVREGEGRLREKGIRIVAALVEDGNSTSLEVFQHLGYFKHDDITYFSKREDADV